MIHLHPSLKQEDVAKLEAKTGMRAKIIKGKAVLVPKISLSNLLRFHHGKG